MSSVVRTPMGYVKAGSKSINSDSSRIPIRRGTRLFASGTRESDKFRKGRRWDGFIGTDATDVEANGDPGVRMRKADGGWEQEGNREEEYVGKEAARGWRWTSVDNENTQSGGILVRQNPTHIIHFTTPLLNVTTLSVRHAVHLFVLHLMVYLVTLFLFHKSDNDVGEE
ncbi:hypothetical protein GYMLUDRAFT_88913 [Collybiopsis luxurians FD-317 M1]|uniref:Unplaced genomic scaffold GYMLUscaffold_108, whole genome shotgun sequence n=1 Tax=Collybiopsis luxurians FD-317 M1 TaxID=944289 RepID=A0A0D0BQ46_9AGAR|nr:hypothetical protein GYMLUDRAFT_88913 [Collybiopsis luxurians FD-317 M1]